MAEHGEALRFNLVMRFSNPDMAAGYVGAMIDGEGSISAAAPKHRAIRVGNTDPALLDAYAEALDVLGIQYTRTKRTPRPPWRDMEQISIFGRRNLELVLALVPLAAPEKRERLRSAVASFKLPNYYRKHEVTREQLVALVERGLTQREIAAELGLRSHSNAQYHLDKHGLKTKRGRCGLL